MIPVLTWDIVRSDALAFEPVLNGINQTAEQFHPVCVALIIIDILKHEVSALLVHHSTPEVELPVVIVLAMEGNVTLMDEWRNLVEGFLRPVIIVIIVRME